MDDSEEWREEEAEAAEAAGHCPGRSDRSLWLPLAEPKDSAVLIVCTLEFEIDPRYDRIVSFEDLRRIAPFINMRLDELDGVLESQVSSREVNLIVAKSAQRQLQLSCRTSKIKLSGSVNQSVAYFYTTYRNTGTHCRPQL